MRARILVAIVLLVAAFWRAAADWHATIGSGYAYKFTDIGTMFANASPDKFESMKVFWRSSGVPYAWDPVGASIMALPVVVVLVFLAGMMWLAGKWRWA